MNVQRNYFKDQEENIDEEEELKQNQMTVVEGNKGQISDVQLMSKKVVLNFGEDQENIEQTQDVPGPGQHIE
jgi:hypothetical protein